MALAFAAFHVAIIFIAASIFVAAAFSDAHSYRIPNYIYGLLIVLFPVFVLTAPHAIDWKQNIGIFGLVALLGFGMFLVQMAGAGDIKLLSVAGLWAGPHLIAVLLVVTAVAACAVSLFMAVATYYRRRANKERIPIPYGVAIAVGGLAVLGMMAQSILMPG